MPLLCIASPKGGVGKTMLTANLADALRRQGRRVLALDLDPQNALRLHFGLPPADGAGFAVELLHGGPWRPHIRQTPAGVALLPHATVTTEEALALAAALEQMPERLTAPLREMLADRDMIVVVDLPPGASRALDLLAPLSDLTIVVLLADGHGAALMPDIDSGRFLGLGALPGARQGRLRLVLNQVDYTSRLSRAVAEAMARHLGPRLLGAVAREDAVAEALAAQRLILDSAPSSRAALDLRELGGAVAGMLPQPAEAAQAWWSR
ncbi:cellulose biosynthesis protein BcsQ [Paracraurococcus lichenis]|uniref:Cellulose biosynthesis protein BcsQ n=1 Tax=Paracraurococcus lichenis TaxID=3064888 RepID=A0ABT9DVZ7_9PROT|nr:cellulose biosynthesis protein BcsQ [Paracraurococcus sp. LOR1-02]MDO9708076.1 cellulose biosynthesis protein BcsQ [Paracraurococcus sp. LOR1-02]